MLVASQPVPAATGPGNAPTANEAHRLATSIRRRTDLRTDGNGCAAREGPDTDVSLSELRAGGTAVVLRHDDWMSACRTLARLVRHPQPGRSSNSGWP